MTSTPMDDEQYNYIAKLGTLYNAKLHARNMDGKFELNRGKAPKAEFSRLALLLHWVGGDVLWCHHWKRCFAETYPYRRANVAEATVSTSLALSAPTPADSSTVLSTDSLSLSPGLGTLTSTAKGKKSKKGKKDKDLEKQKKYGKIRNFFDATYGQDFSNLEKWQQLCADVGIHPIPPSIKQCKAALGKVFINIYDFVDGYPHDFGSLAALRRYSLENDKIYPIREAKKDTFRGGLLHLLFGGRGKSSF